MLAERHSAKEEKLSVLAALQGRMEQTAAETRQSIIPSVLLVILTITHILSPLLLIKNSSKDVFIILPYFLLTAFYCIFELIFVIKYISLLINSVKN